jgi:hypothetical protein
MPCLLCTLNLWQPNRTLLLPQLLMTLLLLSCLLLLSLLDLAPCSELSHLTSHCCWLPQTRITLLLSACLLLLLLLLSNLAVHIGHV